MTDARDQAVTGWTVTKDDALIYSGPEEAARKVYEQEIHHFPNAGIKLYAPPKPRSEAAPPAEDPTSGEAVQRRLSRARDEVVRAVRDRSQDRLMPAIESLVEAKVLSAYLEDGGLIDRLRRLRAALEAVEACLSPSDRAILERPGAGAYVRIPLSVDAYQKIQAALKSEGE
jgi:hypothetical protein